MQQSGAFVSFAQNFEDIILWNALKEHGPGRYVDIGAWDPSIDSVSRSFYERGWRGLHVEPTSDMAARLREARPDEDVLEAVVDAESGTTTLHVVADSGLSTLEAPVAQNAAQRGFSVTDKVVAAVTLSDILDDFGDPIQWLKVDVEGAEERVLRTLSLTTCRPWIVAIEATEPNSTVDAFEKWERHLSTSGYAFALDDGLNRYYTHESSPVKPDELRFPCVFDDFAVSPESSALGRAARNEISSLRGKIQQQDDELDAARRQLTDLAATRDRLTDENQFLSARLGEVHGGLEGLLAKQSALQSELQNLETTRHALATERDWWFLQFHRMRRRRSVRFALALVKPVSLLRSLWGDRDRSPRLG